MTASHRPLAFARTHFAELILAAAILVFALLRTYGLHVVRADEHLYNYMSLLVLEGRWPYRDFFFSHPPAHVYVMALVFAVTGYSLAVAKWVTSLAAIISAVLVLQIGKRLFGKLEGLLAALLFLITPQVLDGSADLTGANIALVFLMAGTYSALVSRAALGGVLLGLATLCGLYAAPMGLMLSVLLLFRSRRLALRLLAGFAGTIAVASLPFLIVAGGAFPYQVVTYNLLKQAHATPWTAALAKFFSYNVLPMCGFVAALALSGLRWKAEGRPTASEDPVADSRWARLRANANPWRADYVGATILLTTIVFGYIALYSTLQVFYSYYFLMLVPATALLTGYVAGDFARYVWRFLFAKDDTPRHQARRRTKRRRTQRRRRAASGSAQRPSLLGPRIVAAVALTATLVHHGQLREQRAAAAKSPVAQYRWHDSPSLGAALNESIRAVFWESEREWGAPLGPITRYLQDESQFARSSDDFVAAVRRECRPNDRIFGDYYFAPYAASVSDCTVAADLADTNNHRIKAGESTLEQWIEAAEADGLSLVVARYPGWQTRHPATRRLIDRFPRVVFAWRDSHVGKVELRRRAPSSDE